MVGSSTGPRCLQQASPSHQRRSKKGRGKKKKTDAGSNRRLQIPASPATKLLRVPAGSVRETEAAGERGGAENPVTLERRCADATQGAGRDAGRVPASASAAAAASTAAVAGTATAAGSS